MVLLNAQRVCYNKAHDWLACMHAYTVLDVSLLTRGKINHVRFARRCRGRATEVISSCSEQTSFQPDRTCSTRVNSVFRITNTVYATSCLAPASTEEAPGAPTYLELWTGTGHLIPYVTNPRPRPTAVDVASCTNRERRKTKPHQVHWICTYQLRPR